MFVLPQLHSVDCGLAEQPKALLFQVFHLSDPQRAVLAILSDGEPRTIPDIAAQAGRRVGNSFQPLLSMGYLVSLPSAQTDTWALTTLGRDAARLLRSAGVCSCGVLAPPA